MNIFKKYYLRDFYPFFSKKFFMTEKKKIYEGHWQKGLQHGKGKLIWLNKGVIQEGIWNQGSAIKSFMYGFPENQFPKLELAQIDFELF